MATTAKAVRPVLARRYDDPFFIGMSLAILMTVILGFGPTYFYRGAVFARLPSPLVHLHGAVFSSWVILYVVQTALVAKKKISLHRTLGTFGGFLAALMVVLGIAATIANIRRGAVPPTFTTPMFLVINCWGVTQFGLIVAWAIAKRRDGAAHKRLMLIAMIALMPPAVDRFRLLMHWSGIAVPVWLLALCLSLWVFDLLTRRRLHYATVLGTVLVLSVQPIALGLSNTTFVQQIAARLAVHR